jgi:hypothetical protein
MQYGTHLIVIGYAEGAAQRHFGYRLAKSAM